MEVACTSHREYGARKMSVSVGVARVSAFGGSFDLVTTSDWLIGFSSSSKKKTNYYTTEYILRFGTMCRPSIRDWEKIGKFYNYSRMLAVQEIEL